MNWGALAGPLGMLGGAGAGYALAPATGGLSAALPFIATGAGLGGATGSVGGQFAPKDMPPPAGAPPSAKPQMPQTGPQPSLAQQLQQNLMPGQGGFLKRPFV